MKKLFFLIAFAALSTTFAHAQLSAGVGLLNSKNKFIDTSDGRTDADKAMSGFYLGVDYNIEIGNGLSVEPGLNYSYMGYSETNSGITSSWRERFLNIPAMAKYTFDVSDDLKVFGFAGPKFVMGLAATVTTKISDDKYSENLYTGKDKLNGKVVNTDAATLSRFDMQMGFGAGVQFRAFSLKLGYDWGVMNRLKNNGGDMVMRRGQFHIGVGYTFDSINLF